MIRFPIENSNGDSISPDMSCYLDWVNSHSLVDLQMSGASFTWSNHQSSSTMCRLDRFLVSTEWLDLYPTMTQRALSKPASDHCPIMLDSRQES